MVHATCALDYVTGAVSSFELNEHLSRMDDTLPLAPPPSIRPMRREDTAGGGKRGERDDDPLRDVAEVLTRGGVELEPARWKTQLSTDTRDGSRPSRDGKENRRKEDTEGGRTRALADARDARRKRSNVASNLKGVETSEPAGRGRTPEASEKRGASRDGRVLEMAERLRAEMDEALDAAAGDDDPLATVPADFAGYVSATASDSLASWWRDSASGTRESLTSASASLTASTARRFMPPDEDDDAALVADQALLDELFRQGIHDVDDDVDDDGNDEDGDARDAYASSSAVGALALETDSAELEADLAEARAAADAGDGDFRGDDATHRVAKSPLE